MRTAAVALMSALLLLLTGLAAGADARNAPKRQKPQAAKELPQAAPRARRAPEPGEWHERDTSKLPFGSGVWWDQMLRENRLTCCS